MPDHPDRQGPPLDQDYHRELYGDWEPLADEEQHGRGLDFGLLLLRLALLLLLPHGLAKAVDMPAFVRRVESDAIGAQAPELFAWLIMVGQVALPVLVALGLFTRPAAFLVAAMTGTVSAFEAYLRLGDTPMAAEGALTGEPALLYVALALPLMFTGAGRWSLDSMRTGGRP